AGGPQVREDALDRVLALGDIDDRIRLTDALDDAMPQREVVEERPQVSHQLEDAEAEDEQGDEDGPEEQEPTDGQDLQHAEDKDEDQQHESSGRTVDGSHRKQA